MSRTVLVFDDVERVNKEYTRRLQELPILRKAKFQVSDPLKSADFESEMGVLTRRRQSTRDHKRWPHESSALDDVDIFIIDYDLLDSKAFLTGETVAYLVRCFSKCGLIIGLNQFGRNTFDLTLRGHPESYADLNIGSDQLYNSGLWGGQAKHFRPWYWPDLTRYLESAQRRISDVAGHPEDAICDVLGMKAVAALLPRRVGQFITGRSRALPAKVTFKAFVTSSGNGLTDKDHRNATPEMIARIGAARISKWLERLVLPSQEILVDAPHLVFAYPSLLKGDPSNVHTWDRTSAIKAYRSLPLDHRKIEKFLFAKDYWLSRPAWFLEPISSSQDIKEANEPWTREATRFVFCEDVSRFEKREPCREFAANVESAYVRRFVLGKAKGVRYAPLVRFLGT